VVRGPHRIFTCAAGDGFGISLPSSTRRNVSHPRIEPRQYVIRGPQRTANVGPAVSEPRAVAASVALAAPWTSIGIAGLAAHGRLAGRSGSVSATRAISSCIPRASAARRRRPYMLFGRTCCLKDDICTSSGTVLAHRSLRTVFRSYSLRVAIDLLEFAPLRTWRFRPSGRFRPNLSLRRFQSRSIARSFSETIRILAIDVRFCPRGQNRSLHALARVVR